MRWQFTSTKLGILLGVVLSSGLIIGAYITAWVSK